MCSSANVIRYSTLIKGAPSGDDVIITSFLTHHLVISYWLKAFFTFLNSESQFGLFFYQTSTTLVFGELNPCLLDIPMSDVTAESLMASSSSKKTTQVFGVTKLQSLRQLSTSSMTSSRTSSRASTVTSPPTSPSKPKVAPKPSKSILKSREVIISKDELDNFNFQITSQS